MTDCWLLCFHLVSVLVVGWYLQGILFQDVSVFMCTIFRRPPKFLIPNYWPLIFEGIEKGKQTLSCLLSRIPLL